MHASFNFILYILDNDALVGYLFNAHLIITLLFLLRPNYFFYYDLFVSEIGMRGVKFKRDNLICKLGIYCV